MSSSFILILFAIVIIAEARELSLCNRTDHTKPVACFKSSYPEAFYKSNAIARVWFKFEKYLLSHCTAWLFGCEGHVLTNKHCVDSQDGANLLEFEFMAQGSECSNECNQGEIPCPGTVHIREPLIFIKTGSSDDLDYTLLKLPPKYCNLSTELGFLSLRKNGPNVDEPVYVPQHPLGYGKRISMFTANNTRTSVLEVNVNGFNDCGDNILTHDADTASGASGSPVISLKDNLVIGLHHCGGCDTLGKNGAISSIALIEDLGEDLPKCAV